MVRAILEGRKTQTRRVVKPQPTHFNFLKFPSNGSDLRQWPITPHGDNLPCPYGKPGDGLWVREAWRKSVSQYESVYYRADEEYNTGKEWGWKPSIHMPRWASRITLEIVSVRVERLQDITMESVVSEGIGFHISNLGARNSSPTRLYEAFPDREGGYTNAKEAFGALWDSINRKKYPWESNPWVWVIEFIHKEAQRHNVGVHGGTI